eukprot:scaffold5885_cov220-Pinguiococcus_pyrenoidosus.AAC.1
MAEESFFRDSPSRILTKCLRKRCDNKQLDHWRGAVQLAPSKAAMVEGQKDTFWDMPDIREVAATPMNQRWPPPLRWRNQRTPIFLRGGGASSLQTTTPSLHIYQPGVCTPRSRSSNPRE